MVVRAIVVSDMHALDVADLDSQHAPEDLATFYRSDEKDSPRHPFHSFEDFLKDEGINADVLLCPGDICDRASSSGLHEGWSDVQRIKNIVGAKLVVATVGNHDADSRYKSSNYDPRLALSQLSPRYPGLTEGLCDRYWSRHFTLHEDNEYRVLSLNCCAYHFAGKATEIHHGRISQSTIEEIRACLENLSPKINIALTHHPPTPFIQDEEDVQDHIWNSSRLQDLIEDLAIGKWIWVHGHKHEPLLTYMEGGGGAPILFSAGAFGAYPNTGRSMRRPANQCHVLELEDPQALRGQIYSYSWNFGSGWRSADIEEGLPHIVGFGERRCPLLLASNIANTFVSNGLSEVYANRIYELFPFLRNCIPRDIRQVERALQGVGIRFEYHSTGTLSAITATRP